MRRGLSVLLVLALGAASCTGSDGADLGDRRGSNASGAEGATPADRELPAEETAGLVDPERWAKRQTDYLTYASSEAMDPSSPNSIMAHAEAAARAGEPVDIAGVTPADFQPIFDKLEAFEDTGDFDVNRLITLQLRYGDELDPALDAEIVERILAFKYWWTEPTPAGIVDSQYYWTENHQIIFLANEYVAGQAFSEETFTNADMTGAEHVAHAEQRLRKWFEWRSRFGFSEWLSNVYWNEDLKGVLLLAEFAEDPEIARLASMTLDMMFVELAGHVQNGTFGSTHGRSYQKDKLNGRDEDTFSLVKMVFDQTPVPYDKVDTATLLAIAQRYRPPQVAIDIAASDEPAVFRTKSSLPIDPNAPVEADPQAPYGLEFEGEDGLMVWWGLGGQFPWQMAPTSVETVQTYDLFETDNFRQAGALESVVEGLSDDDLRALAASLAVPVNPGLLSQVDTYTRRSANVMLSTAQDWRPGQRGEQNHTWQATLDPDALVFTQHPRDPVPSADDPNANEGYWTGDAAIPRSVQYENVNISIYAPQYEGAGGIGSGAYAFTYEDYTHAYFPTEHFEEIVKRNGWVIGRKNDGYVALWSARPADWRPYAEGEFTRDLEGDFDLVAEGGPDNVWITEVAEASDFTGDDPFVQFVDAITASQPEVVARYACGLDDPCELDNGDPSSGALVRYQSPSQGEIDFGWLPKADTTPLPPLVVDGEQITLHPQDLRWESPYAASFFDSGIYHAEMGGSTLDLDFTTASRRSTR